MGREERLGLFPGTPRQGIHQMLPQDRILRLSQKFLEFSRDGWISHLPQNQRRLGAFLNRDPVFCVGHENRFCLSGFRTTQSAHGRPPNLLIRIIEHGPEIGHGFRPPEAISFKQLKVVGLASRRGISPRVLNFFPSRPRNRIRLKRRTPRFFQRGFLMDGRVYPRPWGICWRFL